MKSTGRQATATATMIGTSKLSTAWATPAEMPSTARMSKMLLPTTLPRAIFPWPDQADCTETALSGALVPKAATVSPATRGEMPNTRASLEAPRTNSSAPTTSATRPSKNQIIVSSSP